MTDLKTVELYGKPAPIRRVEDVIIEKAKPVTHEISVFAKEISVLQEMATVQNLLHLESLLAKFQFDRGGFISEAFNFNEIVNDIVKLQARLNTVSRPVLGEVLAISLIERIKSAQNGILVFQDPLRTEIHKAVSHWLRLAQFQLEQFQDILKLQPRPMIFRSGDPANREMEAFVPRFSVLSYLDQLLMSNIGYGLVLYGRRRMGKSTILNNLKGFLPDTVVPVFISMQDPQAFTSLADWMSHLAEKLAAVLPQSSASTSAPADLSNFMRVLSDYNAHLQETNKRILLAIDEYENLDRKLGEKVFPEDLLVTIRESIQTHRNITWIFAGSHEITELKHAEWPSYLVSARTIEVPMFTMAETRLLLTEPLKFSPLFKDESKRPRFEPGFWGENGIERIQEQAGGWPHLAQLIAETIVDVINDADQRQVDDTLFEAALNKAIVSGHNVLYQLLRGECTLPGEWEYLSAFRARETQPLPGDEAIYVSLRRRLLMEEESGHWRLRVPLMVRWLKQRG